MGFFGKLFEKKTCDICSGEIGLLGNRKLEDGNCCKKCAKKLSPYFEERRSSTIEQIKEQLVYREENARQLENFKVTRTIGHYEKMYIEENDGFPIRFFISKEKSFEDCIEKNPDIIPFRDVFTCRADIDVRDREKKQTNSNGESVSYNPPRFEHDYNFYIELEIRNNPYFDRIRFRVNSGTVTIETVGNSGGLISTLTGGINHTDFTIGGSREQKRYAEYEDMCNKICQAVEDGKRAAHVIAVAAASNPQMAEQLAQIAPAAVPNSVPVQSTEPAPQARVKYCTNCGTPASGKFCQNCGESLGG